MNNQVIKTKYLGLAASLCVWLFCAWVSQQPVPAKKAQPRLRAATQRPAAEKRAKTKPATTVTASTTILNTQGVRVDAESGLAVDETMSIVKGQCTACHSSKLILQSHFDRDKWIERIRWMQRTQKLWDLGETEKPILDYLTRYYGPLETPFDGRRLPLPSQAWYK